MGGKSTHRASIVIRLVRSIRPGLSTVTSEQYFRFWYGKGIGLAIGVPLLTKVHIRAKDVNKQKIRFHDKRQQASEPVRYASDCCNYVGKGRWTVANSSYTKAGFLKPTLITGMTIITRLRKDAALHSLVTLRKERPHGRPVLTR